MIAFRGVSKSFAGARALEDVSLEIARGECHALVGENGAGKSTLAKVLAGIHRPDAGTLVVDGVERRFRSPADALAAGIAMVHQELAFCAELSAAENLFMGRLPRAGTGLVDRRAMRERARALVRELGLDLDVDRPVGALSVAEAQVLAIAAATDRGARVLIFDEPTSALSEAEAERLFARIETLRARGTTVIYVSHRLREVRRLADRVSVLRDGRLVETLPRERAGEAEIVRAMIGRPLEEYYPRHLESACGAPVLEVRDLSSEGLFAGVGFDVRAGEVLGLAGLVGAGRSPVALALAGLDPRARGSVRVGGRELELGAPSRSLAAGIALVPEDRKRSGLVLGLCARENWSLPLLARFTRRGLIDRAAEADAARTALDGIEIRCASLELPVVHLSGGNQQKILLSRALALGPRVLILDEPTRGIDVGAKVGIHRLIDGIARSGKAVLLVSSDLPELIALSTRILVLRQGRVAAEIARGDASEERVLRAMTGVSA